MSSNKLPQVALLWAQFAEYHLDRCEAVARHLDGRAHVLAVEVATSSRVYAWPPSRELVVGRKVTLFPGRVLEDLPWWRKLWAEFCVFRKCDTMFCGVGYNEPEIIVLAWLLRLWGVRVVMMTDSKFDDRARSLWFEGVKAALLAPFSAALVAGNRQASYVRFLGFGSRSVALGYDCIHVARIRQQAGGDQMPHGPDFADRHFLFVGRFVEKKNLERLIDAYADYVERAGVSARRLVLVGSGPLEGAMRAQIAARQIDHLVDFIGFIDAEAVSGQMARALALLLVSTEEQWGLVVNEAVAVGLPVIASDAVGATDLLVRNLVNGFVVDARTTDSISEAMVQMTASRAEWMRMSAASMSVSALGDVARFSEGVEILMAGPSPRRDLSEV